MDQPKLASLSLTHVHYVRFRLVWGTVPLSRQADRLYQDPEDAVSFLSAWLALVPQALCIAYVVLIWAFREVEVLLMFAGQLGCEALNFALKRAIKEERPRRTFRSCAFIIIIIILNGLTPER